MHAGTWNSTTAGTAFVYTAAASAELWRLLRPTGCLIQAVDVLFAAHVP